MMKWIERMSRMNMRKGRNGRKEWLVKRKDHQASWRGGGEKRMGEKREGEGRGRRSGREMF
jgi:hypothetical protein